MKPVPATLADLERGGKAALANCLSALEAQPNAPALAALLDAAFAAARGRVVGLTGPPGVGKSSLTRAFIARIRAEGRTVGVIAVDPSSRRTGGALLGDRIRIAADPDDPGVYVRSMAARSRLGGLAEITYPAAVLMRALFDVVFVETVGVGQSETEIADCADVVVFCAQPGSGDALQFMKAGVMEVPDVVLVTKGDLGAAADRAAADARAALSLASGDAPAPEVAVVSAASCAGVDAALERILAGAGGDPARRAAQSRAWVESRLRESFGEVGLAAVRPTIDAAASPFGLVAHWSGIARAAVDEVLKNA